MEKIEESYYQSLYEIGAALNSMKAPEVVLQSIVESLAKAVGARGCSLMLLTPDKKTLIHNVAYGLSDSYVKKGPVSVDKSISESLEGKPVAILDVSKDERIQYPEEARKEEIASVLSVPMMLRDEIIGVIRLYTAERRHFTMEDMYFVGAVANLGAIALENAKLYETLQKDYETFRREMLEYHPERDW